MSSFTSRIRKAEVALKWDPWPAGQPATDLDIVAVTYRADDLHGEPAYVVHFGSRSPDGAIYLNRDSQSGQGFGWDAAMTLELERLDSRYARVVIGVAIQQRPGHHTFGSVPNPRLRIREGYTILAEDDFSGVLESTGATVGEFLRDEAGGWTFHPGIHGLEDGTRHRRVGHSSPGPENDPDDDWPQEP